MFRKYKLSNNFLRRCLGSAFIISGLILTLAICIPSNLLPASFPVLYDRDTLRNYGSVLPAQDDVSGPIFNPNYVMAESTFRSTRDFPTAQSVQNYLDQSKSPLAKYRLNGERAADIIFEAARGFNSAHTNWAGKMITPKLNPALILTKLETEQSLISLSNYDVIKDPDRRMVKATGYGCFDLEDCKDAKAGFFNQVTGAAWQLEYNYFLATNSDYSAEPYQVGKTITTLDENQVYLSNGATAAFYKYTPHVYWGNYNVWKIITINGWGTNQQKWTMTQIDNLNLRNKYTPASATVNDSITQNSVKNLLRGEYKFGDKSDGIKTLQTFLRQNGYFSQDPTGTYGLITQKALDRYRLENNIKIATDSSSNNCASALAANYSSGQSGSDIKVLQQCLRDQGLFEYPTNTGKYAALTQQAHLKFKQSNSPGGNQAAAQNVKVTNSPDKICDSLYKNDWRTGETGLNVRQLQQCLIDKKLLSSKVTGNVGPLTLKALQKVKPNVINVTPTGEIISNVPIKNDSTCASLKKKFYKIGTKSAEITTLQQCMLADKVYNFNVTGLYGYVTDAALVKWKTMR